MSENNQNDPSTAGEDLAIDGLLQEHARLPEGGHDADFLHAVEKALDKADTEAAEEKSDPSHSRHRTRTRVLIGIGTAIAACLPLLLLVRHPSVQKALSTHAPTDQAQVLVLEASKGRIADEEAELDFVKEAQWDSPAPTARSATATATTEGTAEETIATIGHSVDRLARKKEQAAPTPAFAPPSTPARGLAKNKRIQQPLAPAGAPTDAPASPKPNASKASETGAAGAHLGDTIAATAAPTPARADKNSLGRAVAEHQSLESAPQSLGTRRRGPHPTPAPSPRPGREAYAELTDNVFRSSLDHPLSTFSVDVDTASYANLRRIIRSGQRVPADAVRIEEMINYFDYRYPQPVGEHPFSVNLEVGPAAWAEGHRIVRVGLKGLKIDQDERPSANLIFLLDVSGSMNSHDKLPLVKRAMSTLVAGLTGDDTVGIVVYAGSQGIALQPTDCGREEAILKAINQLRPGGSTNGEGGIKLAYRLAEKHFLEDGINRVVLCTDGDFNVGTTSTDELVDLVKRKARSGVFLSVCGFGTGNLNDAMLEQITNDGNGNYFYIDSLAEAEKVFCDDLSGTLVTIAKDVKIQVEFNPAKVERYRLIGYANRMLRNRDFEDDRIDAGEIGAGHTVTALYEIVPPGGHADVPEGTTLRYQKTPEKSVQATKAAAEGLTDSPELLTVKLRYKRPDGDTSTLLEVPLIDRGTGLDEASPDFRFAQAVAGFGMLLRDSEHKAETTRQLVLDLARSGRGKDREGRRKEFLQLVRDAKL